MAISPRSLAFPLSCTLSMLALGPVEAATLTVAPTADTYVTSSTASRSDAYMNQGGAPTLSASQYAGGVFTDPSTMGDYALLRFSLPEELRDAEILSVTLTLTTSVNFGVSQSWAPELKVYQIDALNKGWVEGAANNALGLGASGGHMNNTTATPPIVGEKWASGGLFNQSAGDVDGLLGSSGLQASSANTQVRVALDVAQVREWFTNSDLAEAGVAVHLNTTYTSGYSWLIFHSSQAENAMYRPMLEIEYRAVPEPGTMGLIVLPFLYVFGKKRLPLASTQP